MKEQIGVNGKRVYSGNRHLKGSQAYTREFGRALRKTIQKNAHKVYAKKAELERASRRQASKMVKDNWSDAKVPELMEFLCG